MYYGKTLSLLCIFILLKRHIFTTCSHGGCSRRRGTCSQGGAWSRGVPSPGAFCFGGWLLPRGVPGGDPPDGYCCGRYASYWNAFLLSLHSLFKQCTYFTAIAKGVCDDFLHVDKHCSVSTADYFC